MSDLDMLIAAVIIVGFLAALLGLVVLANLIVIDLVDRHRQRRALVDVDGRRQEREAQSVLRPRSGDVSVAPILAPVDDPRTAA